MACTSQNKEKSEVEIVSNDSSVKSVPQTNELSLSKKTSSDTIITDRLLAFAQFIDSSGYSCDTNRAEKAYNFMSRKNRFNIMGYYFYDTHLKNTQVAIFYNDTLFAKSFPIDLNIFNKVKKITSYFFVVKRPEIKYGKKWFIDGIIEEWKFPDSLTAKSAAINLGKNEGLNNIDVGTLVCSKDNYMYVFTSRNSSFMYIIQPFFEKFAAVNKTNKIY